MSSDTNAAGTSGWWDSSGMALLLRTFKLAAGPSKLFLALLAIILTLILGELLDWAWVGTGHGVPQRAIAEYVAGNVGERFDQGNGIGVFETFSEFEVACLRDAIESVRFGRIIGSVGAGLPADITWPDLGGADAYPIRGFFTDVVLMGRGFLWMATQHWLYALLFVVIGLLIWALFGGAVCRITAMQLARDEQPTVKEAIAFTRERLFGGFFAAPLMPLIICVVTGLFMALGGMFFRIPWAGDIVGGLLFGLALAGGLLVALVVVGTFAGGHLFWPTVAVEGSDSFDAISRSFSYVYARPLRTIFYGLVLIVFGSFCWLFVRFVIWVTLAATHLFVGMGSAITGAYGDAPNKLTALWHRPTFETLHGMSHTLGGSDWVGSSLIALWVMVFLVLGVVWAFLASFYLCGSTVVYFLLRRDVDETDLGEIYTGQEVEETPASTLASGGDVVQVTTPSTASTPTKPDEADEEPKKEEPTAEPPPESKDD